MEHLKTNRDNYEFLHALILSNITIFSSEDDWKKNQPYNAKDWYQSEYYLNIILPNNVFEMIIPLISFNFSLVQFVWQILTQQVKPLSQWCVVLRKVSNHSNYTYILELKITIKNIASSNWVVGHMASMVKASEK